MSLKPSCSEHVRRSASAQRISRAAQCSLFSITPDSSNPCEARERDEFLGVFPKIYHLIRDEKFDFRLKRLWTAMRHLPDVKN